MRGEGLMTYPEVCVERGKCGNFSFDWAGIHRTDYFLRFWKSLWHVTGLQYFLINLYILLGGQLLYNIVVVFAIHQHESAMGVHVSHHPEPRSHLPPHPSELSQSTCFGCPASCIKLALVIYFTYSNIHVSMLFSHIVPPSPSPTVQKSVLCICVFFAVLNIGSSLPSF